jgi:cytochrome b involved in lipid metabolism
LLTKVYTNLRFALGRDKISIVQILSTRHIFIASKMQSDIEVSIQNQIETLAGEHSVEMVHHELDGIDDRSINRKISSTGEISKISKTITRNHRSILLAVAVAAFFLIKNQIKVSHQNSQYSLNRKEMITDATLASHNESSNCWLAIGEHVYDLTEYAAKHPGGSDLITDFCGTNATAEYLLQHQFSLLENVKDSIVGSFTVLGVTKTIHPTVAPTRIVTQISTGSQDLSIQSNPSSSPMIFAESSSPSNPTTTCMVVFYSIATVSAHNKDQDCWLILYNNAYDFTSFAESHPGGPSPILRRCGAEATSAFNRHHAKKVIENVERFAIGKIGDKDGLFPYPCK